MIGPTSHSYFSQRLRLHYVDWGNKDAPPLLMVHGGRDHCRNWDWIAEDLSKDYHVIAPDLRGHGDSQWAVGTTYPMTDFVYDLAQLVHQTKITPVNIISHSLGGNVSAFYASLFPKNVSKLINIEGFGVPKQFREHIDKPIDERLRVWIDDTRQKSARLSKRYKSITEAFERMQAENPHLRADQARHLTIHGTNQNEDGTYSWKFDNYIRNLGPTGISEDEIHKLWGKIECPVLLIHGKESFVSDPSSDGIADCYKNATVANFEGASHWVHHDKLDEFLATARAFLTD